MQGSWGRPRYHQVSRGKRFYFRAPKEKGQELGMARSPSKNPWLEVLLG